MRMRVAIVYNEPGSSRYDSAGEKKAVLGVLDAVAAVHQALEELGHNVTDVPVSPPREKAEKTLGSLEADLVFNLFEGFPGEAGSEAVIPEILSDMEIPYTGCPAPVLKTALDKVKTKKMLIAAGIPTPDFQLLSPQKLKIFRLDYPCIVKPVSEDASHGITSESVVWDFSSLERRLKMISNLYGEQTLVENFIDGREFNVTVLGNSHHTVLPVSEIVFSLPPEMPAILTYDAKWEPESLYYKESKAVCPAKITHREHLSIRELALEAFHLLGCTGYVRVDMRMDKQGHLYVIEVNPNPDISPEAGSVLQAASAGMKYSQFINRIVKMAREKKKNDDKNKTSNIRGQSGIIAHIKKYTGIPAL